jgi:hypothetical protein
MKKLLLISLISGAFISTSANAQGPTTPKPTSSQPTSEQQANMLKDAKAKQAPMLVEKAGLTTAQAEKVIEINFEIRQQAATVLAGLNDADRSAKIAELKAAKEKRYSEIPLTAEQIKAVYAAYQEMGRSTQK